MQNLGKILKKTILAFLLLFSHFFMFSQNLNFGYDFENLLNHKKGQIFKNNFSFDLNNEKNTLGLNIDTGNFISSYDDVSFSSIYFNNYFFIPIKQHKIYSDLLFLNFDKFNIVENFSFNNVSIFLQTIGTKFDIKDSYFIDFCFSYGNLQTRKGKVYSFNLIPEIPSIFSCGSEFGFPFGQIMIQGALLDLAIKSKSFFKVTSHGSQKEFMVAYKNTINFTNSSFKYWIGGLFTGGQIEANTIPASVTLFAEDRLVILGIGTKYLQKIDNFSFKFYFDFIYLPEIYLKEVHNGEIKFFTQKIYLSNYYRFKDWNYLFYPLFEIDYTFDSKKTPLKVHAFLSKAIIIPNTVFESIGEEINQIGEEFSFFDLILSGLRIGINISL